MYNVCGNEEERVCNAQTKVTNNDRILVTFIYNFIVLSTLAAEI